MITADGKLRCLEDFTVDRMLPKFKRVREAVLGDGDGEVRMSSRSFSFASGESLAVSDGGSDRRPGSIWTPIARWWRRLMAKREEERKMTIEEFFKSVKGSAEEIEIVHSRGVGYEARLQCAQKAGQIALAEQLRAGAAAVRAECQLMALGLPRYLEEATLVTFVKQAKKGLRLDWVRNFTRVIPSDVLEKKSQADEREIFDNYVVLHYDPDKKSWAETEAEKAKRKDPILFGLIEGRRRLYFVGDWVDEFCDLTLDQIADQLGAGAVETLS